ncbi:MAG TPA: sulfite exporter TauE/SafE family protein [Caulobacteraceae bacterium]|nr:sulfite exporter TauE/SafE family protein [Caulobacteraceae bacterium]
MHFESLGWLLPLAALLAAGLFAGFCAGMFGIGGGFVVVPAMLLVLPLLGGAKAEYAHVAVGTSAATIIVASLRSVTAHAKRGAVDFEVLKSRAPWLIVGVVVGVALAGHVDGRGLLLIFAIGVILMSVNFLAPRLSEMVVSTEMPSGLAIVAIAGPLGAFSSLLGIGGGTIAVTVMTWCSRTIHRAIATASGMGVLIAAPTAVGFAIIGFGRAGLPWGSIGYVNLPAAIAISSMSILTAPLGVAAAHRLPSGPLKRVFGGYLVLISLFMFRNALKA